MIQEFNSDLIYLAIKQDISSNGYASISRVQEKLLLDGISADVTVIKQRIDSLNEKDASKDKTSNFYS
jgi:hypothetical protein